MILSLSSSRVMYPHSYHCVTFFKDSALFCPQRHVKLNCFTFHYYLCLTPADADLFWAMGRCFVCAEHGHRSDVCPNTFGSVRYACSFLGDPYCELLVVLACVWFCIDVSLQHRMTAVIIVSRVTIGATLGKVRLGKGSSGVLRRLLRRMVPLKVSIVSLSLESSWSDWLIPQRACQRC